MEGKLGISALIIQAVKATSHEDQRAVNLLQEVEG
jgi:hypothetical protein